MWPRGSPVMTRPACSWTGSTSVPVLLVGICKLLRLGSLQVIAYARRWIHSGLETNVKKADFVKTVHKSTQREGKLERPSPRVSRRYVTRHRVPKRWPHEATLGGTAAPRASCPST